MANQIEVLKQTELLGQQFEVYGTPQEPLFKAQDVATLINHSNITKMLALVDEDEKGLNQLLTPGGNQQVWFLTENGLYEVLMQSRKPIAKQFKKGVKAILKEIRTNGGYIASQQEDTPEMIMARALQVAQSTIEKHQQQLQILKGENENLLKENSVLAPKAEYTDRALQSISTLTINQIAMELRMSAIRLNKFLELKGVQYRQGRAWVLHSKYRDKGYTELRTHKYIDSNGDIRTSSNMVWTERGRQFIHSII